MSKIRSHAPLKDQLETLSQAHEWDKTKNHYTRLGLCSRCAAQAAWGHADGFSSVHSPCWECLPAIAALPTEEPGGWRSQSRRLGRALSLAVKPPAAI